jgi:hypothetical protein
MIHPSHDTRKESKEQEQDDHRHSERKPIRRRIHRLLPSSLIIASRAEPPRTLHPRNSVNKALLVHLLTLRSRIGAQPQRDVIKLHRLPDHTYQVIAQGVQVGLIPELGGESL